jgi:DnaK suppressor protein
MEGSTLKQIRDTLLERRRQIGEDLERGRESGAENADGHSAEMCDVAQSLEQLDRDKSLAEQERRELHAIERALAKMMTGHFGICEDCDEEIPSKRLMVLPYARLCAKCQAMEERLQGRSRGMPSIAAR